MDHHLVQITSCHFGPCQAKKSKAKVTSTSTSSLLGLLSDQGEVKAEPVEPVEVDTVMDVKEEQEPPIRKRPRPGGSC